MTAGEAIQRADALMPNQFTEAEKLRWLESADGLLAESIGGELTLPYTAQTALLAGAPYEELYVHWLQAKALYFLGEFVRYQNAMAQFNSLCLSCTAAACRAGGSGAAALRF